MERYAPSVVALADAVRPLLERKLPKNSLNLWHTVITDTVATVSDLLAAAEREAPEGMLSDFRRAFDVLAESTATLTEVELLCCNPRDPKTIVGKRINLIFRSLSELPEADEQLLEGPDRYDVEGLADRPIVTRLLVTTPWTEFAIHARDFCELVATKPVKK